MQGISRNRPIFREIRLENIRESSSLRGISQCGGAGNFFARAGNHFRWLGISQMITVTPRGLGVTVTLYLTPFLGGVEWRCARPTGLPKVF